MLGGEGLVDGPNVGLILGGEGLVDGLDVGVMLGGNVGPSDG